MYIKSNNQAHQTFFSSISNGFIIVEKQIICFIRTHGLFHWNTWPVSLKYIICFINTHYPSCHSEELATKNLFSFPPSTLHKSLSMGNSGWKGVMPHVISSIDARYLPKCLWFALLRCVVSGTEMRHLERQRASLPPPPSTRYLSWTGVCRGWKGCRWIINRSTLSLNKVK